MMLSYSSEGGMSTLLSGINPKKSGGYRLNISLDNDLLRKVGQVAFEEAPAISCSQVTLKKI